MLFHLIHFLLIPSFFLLGIFRDNSFFIGSNAREAVNSGRADFVPIFLSEIPLLFHRKIIQLDVALINV
jgi:acyl-CoA hydrolase